MKKTKPYQSIRGKAIYFMWCKQNHYNVYTKNKSEIKKKYREINTNFI